jgi:hypothetical protein
MPRLTKTSEVVPNLHVRSLSVDEAGQAPLQEALRYSYGSADYRFKPEEVVFARLLVEDISATTLRQLTNTSRESVLGYNLPTR